MYDSRDSFYWNGSREIGGPGLGYWNRDAYVNEKPSFDPANAHQDQSGTYHYHANPPALRYLLHDNIAWNSSAGTYAENVNSAALHHSPILGWVRDGCPIYGPYGYSNPTDSNSGVRRMISGFVLRDGSHGADNLHATGRTTLPAWAARFYRVAPDQSGPPVNGRYPVGRYLEDHAYLGDLGKKQGVDFDLDECNGRFCVTPEFPQGTYAYFVAIDAEGTPEFPYNIGRAFHGDPLGGKIASISEPVVTNFAGGPGAAASSAPEVVTRARQHGDAGLEFGRRRKLPRRTLRPTQPAWTTRAADVPSQGLKTQARLEGDAGAAYRSASDRTNALSDPVIRNGSGIAGISPIAAARGDSVTVTVPSA